MHFGQITRYFGKNQILMSLVLGSSGHNQLTWYSQQTSSANVLCQHSHLHDSASVDDTHRCRS